MGGLVACLLACPVAAAERKKVPPREQIAAQKAAAERERVAQEEAAAVSQVAAAKNVAGEFTLCGNLYQQAYRTDPSFLGYLFSAARCEQKAGDLDAGERDFRLFLARSPSGDDLNEKAQQFLDEILDVRRKAVAAKAAEPVVPPVVPVPTVNRVDPPGHGLAWTSLIGGGVLVAAGGLLVANGLALRTDLETALVHKDGGLIADSTPEAARASESTYRTRLALGAGLATAGVAAIGVGVWLYGRAPKQVAVTAGPAPLGIGLTLAWR